MTLVHTFAPIAKERTSSRLRSLQHIEKPAIRDLARAQAFKPEDLSNVIFNGKLPEYTEKPFATIPHVQFTDLPVTFSLSTTFDPTTSNGIQEVARRVARIGARAPYLKVDVSRFPNWVVAHLVQAYQRGLQKWCEYVEKEIATYCKTYESQINWAIVTQSGLPYLFRGAVLSYEQKVWIAANTFIDKNEEQEFWLKMRESLLPWLDYKMWVELDKVKKNKRINTAFESQRKAMVEGKMEDLETLDIIK